MRLNQVRPLVAACAALIASANATAMYVNDKGEGQVLIYPYYSVNHGQQTLLSVSNTDSNGKALRIAFREGLNGRPVLSFNIYLSAHDTWTGVVFALSDAGLGAPNSAAAIGSTDKSCTSPSLPLSTASGMHYQPFLNYAYIGNAEDTGPTTLDRTREGFFEIIEMADVNSTLVDASTTNCSGVLNLSNAQLKPPTGGLTGRASIIDVAEGTYYGFDATAIQGFLASAKYSLSGTDDVNLSSASGLVGGNVASTALVDGKLRELNYPSKNAIDAVSALLMSERLDLQLENSAGIFTDWVITFPTKQYYVDPALTGNATAAIAPFREPFGSVAGTSQLRLSMDVWDRDGHSVASDAVAAILPYETNVLSRTAAPSGALAAMQTSVPLLVDANTAGQATLSLSPTVEPHLLRAAADGTVLEGLPAIGFEAIKYVNANVTAGVLANYSGTYPLKGR